MDLLPHLPACLLIALRRPQILQQLHLAVLQEGDVHAQHGLQILVDIEGLRHARHHCLRHDFSNSLPDFPCSIRADQAKEHVDIDGAVVPCLRLLLFPAEKLLHGLDQVQPVAFPISLMTFLQHGSTSLEKGLLYENHTTAQHFKSQYADFTSVSLLCIRHPGAPSLLRNFRIQSIP